MTLRLVAVTNDGAQYSVELATRDGVWTGRADVVPGADARLGDWDHAPAPDWLVEAVRAHLRTVARNAGASVRLGPKAGWPRRIQRWRSEP